jgi:hypothetical protein
VSRRRLALAAALVALLAPATALADADPASDYLYSRSFASRARRATRSRSR